MTPPDHSSETPLDAASAWLARRDRGLTAAEQDAYLQWLRENSAHGQAIAQLEKTWGRLDTLAEWRPKHSEQPNPDLLAVSSRTATVTAPRGRNPARRLAMIGVAAAAAAIAVFIYVERGSASRSGPLPAVSAHGVSVTPLSERLVLADGSVVELNQGGKIDTAFTAGERRVRLLRGEAHFAVTKNPERPFVVEAGTVAVRAVGTAFDVRRTEASVEVLVTEGKVHVERPQLPDPTPVVKGERAVIDTRTNTAAPVVTSLTPGEIESALSWEGVRLAFTEQPLSEVIAEFNLRNHQQLAVGDAETGRLSVTAKNFRANNVEGFVRLLEGSFGVTTERRADGTIVLRVSK